MNNREKTLRNINQLIVIGLLVWQFGLTALLTLGGGENPKLGTLSKMVWGLNILWVLGFGYLSIRLSDRFVAWGRTIQPVVLSRFTLVVIGLALIEEAITTAMTNCAPLFGSEIGEVYITASANYIDVVLFHSVVVFIPQFMVLALILKRYAISPFCAFLSYGCTGFVNEALFSGPNPLQLAQWILVYGLLVYLPAHLFLSTEGRQPVRWWLWPLIVIAPAIGSIPMVALLLYIIAPGHPSIHFPPM